MQTKRRKQAETVRQLREAGATWKDVEAKASIKPDLGRALLKELEAHEAETKAVEEAKETLRRGAPKEKPSDKPVRRSGRYIKATCKCDGPNVIRTSPTALARGITCGGCGKGFKEAR